MAAKQCTNVLDSVLADVRLAPAWDGLPGSAAGSDDLLFRLIKTMQRPADQRITDWKTNPVFCRGLAFLRAHAVMLLARRRIPIGV